MMTKREFKKWLFDRNLTMKDAAETIFHVKPNTVSQWGAREKFPQNAIKDMDNYNKSKKAIK